LDKNIFKTASLFKRESLSWEWYNGNMNVLNVVREVLDIVYQWHRVPSSVKAKAVLLYFRGISLRYVQKYLSDEGYRVSIEAIREWFHSVDKMLKVLYIWNVKYETFWRWLSSFITLYTLLEVKTWSWKL